MSPNIDLLCLCAQTSPNQPLPGHPIHPKGPLPNMGHLLLRNVRTGSKQLTEI